MSYFISSIIYGFEKKFLTAVNQMPLTIAQREVLKFRYLVIIRDAKHSHWYTTFFYHLFVNIITIFSVLTAAFAAFVQSLDPPTKNVIIWILVAFGIAETMANNWLYVFSIPKKYVMNAVTLEKLQSEGWSFVAGINKYDIGDMDIRWKLFCTRVEKLKLKYVGSMPEMQGPDVASDMLAAGNDSPGGHTGENHDILHSNSPLSPRSKRKQVSDIINNVMHFHDGVHENTTKLTEVIVDTHTNICQDSTESTNSSRVSTENVTNNTTDIFDNTNIVHSSGH